MTETPAPLRTAAEIQATEQIKEYVAKIGALQGRQRIVVMEAIHDGLIKEFGIEGAKELWMEVLAVLCQIDSPEGYASFYEGCYGFRPSRHIMRIIQRIYIAHEKGVGTLAWAWTGSWKTVSLAATFVAFRIGKEPYRTNLVVAANDDSAEKITKACTEIISDNPFWKVAQPSIVPDTERGWAINGYFVKDESIDYGEWKKKVAGRIDPTLIGGGYLSTRIGGKHPDGVLVIDDIHDINNSSSELDRKHVVQAMQQVILKRPVRKADKLVTWLIADGTPWAVDDGYHMLKDSGQFEFIRIPAMVKAGPDDPGAVYCDGVNPNNGLVYEDIVGWWVLEWPEHYGLNSIISDRAYGKQAFWQTIMLDLETSKSGTLKYYAFDSTLVDIGWWTIGGADPTNIIKPAREGARRSSFALACVSKLPQGGAVVVDGILEPCSQQAAENFIISMQSKYSNWQTTMVENVGGGAGWLQTLHRNPNIRAMGSGVSALEKDKGQVSKSDRIHLMSKWFENNTVRISTANTPFLNALRRLFDEFFDLDPNKPDDAWDAGDAVYHALRGMPDILRDKPIGDEIRAPGEPVRDTLYSPWQNLGAKR